MTCICHYYFKIIKNTFKNKIKTNNQRSIPIDTDTFSRSFYLLTGANIKFCVISTCPRTQFPDLTYSAGEKDSTKTSSPLFFTVELD